MSRKPQRASIDTENRIKTTKIMDNQDRKRGDSLASKTERITFCTNKMIAETLTNEAHDRRISRSELIECAVKSYLNL